MVQTNTVQGPGGEAGVMRIKGSGTPGHEIGLAMALDGNSRWCYLDPKLGAMHAVAEAARKVACTGATPVAATNCLNFGNPEKPEIMAQLSAAIDGISEACTALGTPDHRRQCLALQRDPRRRDLSHSGHRNRRHHRRREQGGRRRLQVRPDAVDRRRGLARKRSRCSEELRFIELRQDHPQLALGRATQARPGTRSCVESLPGGADLRRTSSRCPRHLRRRPRRRPCRGLLHPRDRGPL